MVDDSFKEFVLDQLSALSHLRTRAMFGAHGLYQAEHFFAIVDNGRVFFKTNRSTAPAYIARGTGPFTYQSQGKTVTLSFHEVPPDVLENVSELTEWARRAVQVAAEIKKSRSLK